MRKNSELSRKNRGTSLEFSFVALLLGTALLLSIPGIDRYITTSISIFIANLHAS